MFWKKKKKIDLKFPEQDGDQRDAYRVKPDQLRPIILSVAGNSYHVVNISGSGCCFRSHNFPEGHLAAGTLRIPSEDLIFPVTIRVVYRKRDICHCEFTKISAQSADELHSYVLRVQKDSIRNRHAPK